MVEENITTPSSANDEPSSFNAIKEAASLFRSLKGIKKLDDLAFFYTLLEKSGDAKIFRDIIVMKKDYDLLDEINASIFPDLLLVLKKLSSIVDLLARSQSVNRFDREKYYAEMVWIMDKIQDEIDEKIILPVERDYIKSFVIPKWKYLVLDAIKNLAGKVALEMRIKAVEKTRQGIFLILTVTNNGDAVAENVRIELICSKPVMEQLYNISSHKETTVRFQLGSRDLQNGKIKLVCVFDDLGAKNKTIEFEFDITGPSSEKIFHPLWPNPYKAGPPMMQEKDLFFGRDDMLRKILNNLNAGTQSSIYMLSGERRTGKTSILYRLKSQVSQGSFFPVLIDLQGMIDPGDDAFIFDIAQTIVLELQKNGYEIQSVVIDEFREAPANHFETIFLPQVIKVLDSCTLVLLIDEIAMLEKRVNNRLSTPAIYSFLRSLMSHNNFKFVLAGTVDYSANNDLNFKELLNITIKEKIEYLLEAETYQLATLPLEGFIEIEQLGLEKLWEITAGHPFFVQLVCQQLVDFANDNEITNLGVQQVRSVIPDAIDRGDAQLSDIWNALTPDSQKILVLVGRLLEVKQIATPYDIQERLNRLSINIDLDENLKELIGHGILIFDSGHYRFKVSLFGEWVNKYRSIENLI